MEVDFTPASRRGQRPSATSSGRRDWSQGYPMSTTMSESQCDPGPAYGTLWRQYESFPEIESTFDPDPMSVPEIDGQASEARSTRPTAAPSQPVLVRAFTSDEARALTSRLPVMSPRRLIPFFRSKTSPLPAAPGPPLPSDEDFSIDSILQAIDADITGTLDSIAEICGRSKLSLSNEYDSHIAPLGEIRASSAGGLGPVNEASAMDADRAADENVMMVEDRPIIGGDSREIQSLKFFYYLGNVQYAETVPERSAGSPALVAARNANVVEQPPLATRPVEVPLPTIFEYPTRAGPSGRSLLGQYDVAGNAATSQHDMFTHALVSEVHLDAQDNERRRSAEQRVHHHVRRTVDGADSIYGWTKINFIQSMLGWLNLHNGGTDSHSQPKFRSAEDRLRAMLRQAAEEQTSLPAA
ncbi:hypothetical protein N7539_000367 [Penicillium diatomitis]|uniref:Uncharacterized protein n=1 Tax=Penicillium diatomitis TaxID=2819901 RepID=A0A9X0C295_9EURO|nr:uncharacterized protein N7539_000367 [Penicillium diatomitis]KAJ5495251.1 hypothetical protein N7539_000367 [Penicillium diatomitis]